MHPADRWAEENAAYFDPPDVDVIAMVLASWRVAAGPPPRGGGVPPAGAVPRPHTKTGVHASQVKKRVASWPRGSVRSAEIDTGPLAYGMTLHVDGRKPIPCRAPKLPKNPASAYAIATLGGELPG